MIRAALFIPVCLLGVICSAEAAEKRPLRWKLNPGDVFHVEFRQRVSEADSLGAAVARAFGNRPPSSHHDLAFVFLWEVTGATDPSQDDNQYDSKIALTQTLKRVVYDEQFSTLSRTQYDSAKPPDPVGLKWPTYDNFHKTCQAFIDKPVKIFLTRNGRLDYDKSAVDSIAKSSGEWFFKSQLAGDDIGALMGTLLPQFPADATNREPWQRDVTLHVGTLFDTGKMVYTYTPQASRGNSVRIRLDGKLHVDNARGDPDSVRTRTLTFNRVANHTCAGEIRFDNNAGHVTMATLQQLVLEDVGGGVTRKRHEKSVQLKIRRDSDNHGIKK